MDDLATKKQVLAGGSLLAISMIAAGGGNYLANLVLSATLTPAEFGDAALMVTFLLGSTVITGGTQLLTAKATAEDSSSGAVRVQRIRIRSLWFSLILAATALAASPALASAFGLASGWLIPLMALGLPAHVALSVDRGQLQGNLELASLAKTFLAEVALRLTATVALLALGLGAVGATIAINAAFVAGLVVSRAALGSSGLVLTSPRHRPVANGGTNTARTAAQIAVLSLATVLITNGDLVAAKILLSPDDAGRYALVGLVGRVVYMLAIALHGTMIPLMIRASDDDRTKVKKNCLRVVGLASMAAIACIWILDDLIVVAIGGSEYRSSAGLLGPYALAAGLFALASTSATLEVSVGRFRESWMVMGGALLQTGLLTFGAPISATQIVMLQILAMALLLTAVVLGNKVENPVEALVRSKPWRITTSTTSSF